jgi:3,4-dihydroxy 2-butanone 4-phosphate synthase / GTP cyclohydrolase II
MTNIDNKNPHPVEKSIGMLASIDEIIAQAKLGKMFILVDDEERENEGDLVILAEFANADAINFMAKHGRGLICLALTSQKIAELNLKMMVTHNESPYQTAFTVSIEARKGVTTGISAYDRATTIAAAIKDYASANDIVSPGHIFPLKARDGGVLERMGHTEASIDLAKLAGLKPAAVICEIIKDDGKMARLNDLYQFASIHQLKITSIEKLKQYILKS